MDNEAKMFKALSDPTRLRLSALLTQQREVCVCKLTEALNEPQFKISRHLGVLRNAGLVDARREGTWMYYRLTAPKTDFDRSLRNCLLRCAKNMKTDVTKTHSLTC